MKTIKYYKLVRDKIPELIEKEGKQSVCSVLSDEEYLEFLDRKLSEELEEYLEDKSMEELADLLEVMMAVAKARGSSIEEIERIRQQKADKRGGFEKKILLEEVRIV
ncbi:nucleoside triphosphate pyrophosphohydrolase [Aristaeella lactis]|uniref:Predicted house-cleaning noncanonical NTP pyrophosphatase, all-alpha NTP-PPase (MazG) superfamily n=1 Tax=Aristaeella lactis TaxID=3046383 RepID=A0AC61PML6_9FIRM|nr:nucleoside triphosphate pyrophosphohydrolase [Aristaeella lactis]QUA52620.1 nucleoside triphosphate pyrophosphohydrolase [Aristaeella lactis]SMC70847.1 Predicted house-cleaning noncanonical NTP pyrophosphatase, all-alpha NTP-PPase (MazG) superfamily [Aristaeella lactis]